MITIGAELREKTQTYLKMKGELAAVRAESVVLRRTEQILKGRDEVSTRKQDLDNTLSFYNLQHVFSRTSSTNQSVY